ncbi:hypothetical protein RSJ42_08600 [Methanosarcina hadiensis]|uniref:hypothetical protein n=1 Tax=Methanosarcina hadiensis TaxID=3078083 RepID=UPI003977DA57
MATIEKNHFNPVEFNEGFILLGSIDKTNFYFQYLRKSSFTYGEYQNELILKKGETIKETLFEIDLEKMLLFIYSGKSQSDFLVRKLEAICGDLFTPFEIDFAKVFDLLRKSKYICRIEQIEIANFKYKDFLMGKYTANIQEETTFRNIMNEYGLSVMKVVLSIEDYDGNFSLVKINKAGSFLFESYSENNSDILRYAVLNFL